MGKTTPGEIPPSQPFGETGGRAARLYTLENSILKACISDYAGVLVSLEAPDRTGRRDHVVLGFDDVAAYVAAGASFGALLGRTANRIADGRFTLDGTVYALAKNENGETLHGGPGGFNAQFWSVVDGDAEHLTLALQSPEGDQGFPGAVAVEATWRLDGAELSLTFAATTDKPTPLSLSAHPYFNLDGIGGNDGALHCLDHQAEIFADAFLPTDDKQIPTGEIRAVDGTPFDFRGITRLGARIGNADRQLRFALGYDHYFILPDGGATLRRAVRVRSPASGRTLEVSTTQRGVQLYTGNNLDGSVGGRGGLYRQSAGFAIEPQGFPDAPNQPAFPSTILRPGETYRETIVYRFRTEGQEIEA